MRVRLRSGVLRFGPLLAAGLVMACSSRVLPPPPESDPMDREAYVIGTADVLNINVWRNPEISSQVPVRPDGKISLPLLDDVQAAGLTPEELKEVVTEALREFVDNPDVTVTVSNINSKLVYFIGGGVARQGPVPLNRELRILDALSLAGGFREFADKNDVRILRRTSDGLEEYRFDYDAYLDGKAPDSNLLLRPGDTIVVKE